MDLSDPHNFELFLAVYGTLPRAGPGSDEHTLRALTLVPGATPVTVLDLGCGPGAQTVALARALPDARILALDILPGMASETNRRLDAESLSDRARAEVGDMADPPVASHRQELIWCEGAIYFLGVFEGLTRWRPLLSDGGSVVFTEPLWLRQDPPNEVRQWWESQYPAITNDRGIREAVAAAGYSTVASFPLPAACWWDEYYRPMEDRIASLLEQHPDDPVAAEVAEEAELEIRMHRRYSDCYSYGFFVVYPDR